MKSVCAIVLLLAAASASASARPSKISSTEFRGAFKEYMSAYNKVYEADEFPKRFAAFQWNYQFVKDFQPTSYTVAINEFADMRSEEFARLYKGYHARGARVGAEQPSFSDADVAALPASVDWRTKGAVTPVKNQGQCGSCWSFSTTGSLEGAHFLSGKKLVGLSEQNLMDCSQKEGNMGCSGGLMDDAFKYIISNKGIDTEASYPYTAQDGKTCKFNPANVGATMSSYVDVQSGNETALQVAVATVGPVSIAIDASQPSFQAYSGGVYWSYLCSSTKLDHGVLAVGYGEQKNWEGKMEKYWIVKNSWGGTWGDQGYIKMIRDWKNDCGVSTAASYPVV